MASALFPLIGVVFLGLAILLQVNVVPVVRHTLGVGQAVRPINNGQCQKIPGAHLCCCLPK